MLHIGVLQPIAYERVHKGLRMNRRSVAKESESFFLAFTFR